MLPCPWATPFDPAARRPTATPESVGVVGHATVRAGSAGRGCTARRRPPRPPRPCSLPRPAVPVDVAASPRRGTGVRTAGDLEAPVGRVRRVGDRTQAVDALADEDPAGSPTPTPAATEVPRRSRCAGGPSSGPATTAAKSRTRRPWFRSGRRAARWSRSSPRRGRPAPQPRRWRRDAAGERAGL